MNNDEELGLDYDRDLRPLLGNELVVGTPATSGRRVLSADIVAALEVRDRSQLLRLALDRPAVFRPAGEVGGARRFTVRGEGPPFAVNGDELVFAESRSVLEAALRQRERPDGLSRDEFERRSGALGQNAFGRGYVGGRELIDTVSTFVAPELALLREIRWVRALRTLSLAAIAPTMR